MGDTNVSRMEPIVREDSPFFWCYLAELGSILETTGEYILKV